MLTLSLIGCKNGALKNICTLKEALSASKKKRQVFPDLPYSFYPIDCCFRINHRSDSYSMMIFSHRYLDSDCRNFQTCVFLAVYWSIWTFWYNTGIKVPQVFKNRASAMLNNVCNWGIRLCCFHLQVTLRKSQQGAMMETMPTPASQSVCSSRCSVSSLGRQWAREVIMGCMMHNNWRSENPDNRAVHFHHSQ